MIACIAVLFSHAECAEVAEAHALSLVWPSGAEPARRVVPVVGASLVGALFRGRDAGRTHRFAPTTSRWLSFSSSHKSQLEAQFHGGDHERVDACAVGLLGIKVSDGREKLPCGLLRGAEDVVQGLDLEDAVSRAYHAAPPFSSTLTLTLTLPSGWRFSFSLLALTRESYTSLSRRRFTSSISLCM